MEYCRYDNYQDNIIGHVVTTLQENKSCSHKSNISSNSKKKYFES